MFGIFGHGNVTCLGEALYDARGVLPTYRGQSEQGMALAAIGFAKAMRRRQFMAATSSVGPGAMNMVTAAAVAHANRLPLLLLAGDTFHSRIPDPVLQQVEHFDEPSMTVNDAFRPVTRYWDRITSPAQVAQSLPLAIATLLDPADCGPAFLGLPQDVQAEAYDYPVRLFEPVVHEVRRQRPDHRELAAAVAALRGAKAPLIVAGGGVHYALAEQRAARLRRGARRARRRDDGGQVEPARRPSALRGADRRHRLSAGQRARRAGRRGAGRRHAPAGLHHGLVDRLRQRGSAHRRAQRRALRRRQAPQPAARLRCARGSRGARLGARRLVGAGGLARARRRRRRRRSTSTCARPSPRGRERRSPRTRRSIAAVNSAAGPDDYAVSSAGGFPGELNVNWLARGVATFDCEYGFSCMGYELAGAWGASMARARGEVFAFVGDGSYLMLNSELLSSVISGHKLIAVLCDNGGYAVIERLQVGQGGASFNNMFATIGPNRVDVDWVAHARSLGCEAERVDSIDDLPAALLRARAAERTYVIALRTAPDAWTEGGAFWQVGVPEVSERPAVDDARARQSEGRSGQRVGW